MKMKDKATFKEKLETVLSERRMPIEGKLFDELEAYFAESGAIEPKKEVKGFVNNLISEMTKASMNINQTVLVQWINRHYAKLKGYIPDVEKKNNTESDRLDTLEPLTQKIVSDVTS